jgi:hypothetical protein
MPGELTVTGLIAGAFPGTEGHTKDGLRTTVGALAPLSTDKSGLGEGAPGTTGREENVLATPVSNTMASPPKFWMRR